MAKLRQTDQQIYKLIKQEERRQKEVLEMIPSENYTSQAVREALGSVLTNKYSEGYPKKRYYQGNLVIDQIEIIAKQRAQDLFGVPYANVQAYSGSPANTAVYFALLKPLEDKIMGLSLAFGGHLTHGSSVSFSGKYFRSVSYGLNRHGLLDYEQIRSQALLEKPKIIVCGFTAYSHIVDFSQFAKIAQEVNAFLLADISHIAGLVVSGVHPSPVAYADIVTTTTHKTLRGPRGAIIMITSKGLMKDPMLGEKIDKALFPGLQGGPHDNQTAAIAVSLKEAGSPAFKAYGKQIIINAKKLAGRLIDHGFDIIGGGTQNHLMLIDLSNKKLNGAQVAFALEVGGIVVNKNAVPGDTMSAFYPSGIRLGTPAITTRGMGEKEMIVIADWINVIAEELKIYPRLNKENISSVWGEFKKEIIKNKTILDIGNKVRTLCEKFPLDK